MASQALTFPTKSVGGETWYDLTAYGVTHEICGETIKQKSDMSFGGQHRVRLFVCKKNVHWRPVQGLVVDISEVPPAEPPRRARR